MLIVSLSFVTDQIVQGAAFTQKKKFFYLCLSAEESDLNSGDMNRLTFT